MKWEREIEEKFKLMISKIPLFHRRMAESAVIKRAEENAGMRGAQVVQEADVISAFFSDVPIPFYSMMVRLMDQTGLDYRRYGFPKNGKAAQ